MPRSVNGDEWWFGIGFRKLPVFREAVKPRLVGGDRSHGATFFTTKFLNDFAAKVNPVRKSSTFQREGSHGALNPLFVPKGTLSLSPLEAAGLSNGVKG